MAQISYDEVNLMLRLYDMRREPRLRQARAWFTEHFHPESPEEMMQRYPQGSEENTYIRMVISYWDMVAGIVNRGLINDELFFRQQRRDLGGVGPHAVHRPDMARGVQEPTSVSEYRGDLQAAGSVAREARPGFVSGDATTDGAGKNESIGYLVCRKHTGLLSRLP